MRTTLTLDPDTAQALKNMCSERDVSFKTVVNETLRAGIAALTHKSQRKRTEYRISSVDLGEPHLPDVDNISEVLSFIEGD